MGETTEQGVRQILETIQSNIIRNDNMLSCSGTCVDWHPAITNESVILDGEFTAQQLAAIVWWMENKGEG